MSKDSPTELPCKWLLSHELSELTQPTMEFAKYRQTGRRVPPHALPPCPGQPVVLAIHHQEARMVTAPSLAFGLFFSLWWQLLFGSPHLFLSLWSLKLSGLRASSQSTFQASSAPRAKTKWRQRPRAKSRRRQKLLFV